MEPKDLKRLYDDKKAAAATKVATATAANTKAHDEIDRKDIAGKTALRNVVLPYLTEVAASFGKGEFVVQPIIEPRTKVPSGVSFRIGQGLEYSIEVDAGNVNVTTRDLRIKGQVGLKTKFLHSGDRELFIKGVDDLTREKVGYLVKLAIDKG